jgi:uncharacterized protein YbaR (Trm112 family)
MHLLVTDRLSCVRCGPDFRLILSIDEMSERRVLEGALACSNCRERYPIGGGAGDLRLAPREPLSPPESSLTADRNAAVRLAALLGVERGPGLLVVAGSSAWHAHPLSQVIEGIEVAVLRAPLHGESEQKGVSRISVSDRLPFLTGSVRGAVIEGDSGVALLSEVARVLGTGSRLVFLGPPGTARALVQAHGLRPIAESDETLISQRK